MHAPEDTLEQSLQHDGHTVVVVRTASSRRPRRAPPGARWRWPRPTPRRAAARGRWARRRTPARRPGRGRAASQRSPRPQPCAPPAPTARRSASRRTSPASDRRRPRAPPPPAPGSDSSGCRTISFVTVSSTRSSTGATRSDACGYIGTQSGSRANRAPSCPAKITPGSAARTEAAISAATPAAKGMCVEHLARVQVEQHRAVHAHAQRVDAEVEVEPLHPARRPSGRGEHREPAAVASASAAACGPRSCRRRAAACRRDRTRRAPAGGRSRRLRVGHRRRRRRHCGAARRPVAGGAAERVGERRSAAPARRRRSRRSACRARSRAHR